MPQIVSNTSPLIHLAKIGESEAIALALETNADLILLDDAEAREKARLYN